MPVRVCALTANVTHQSPSDDARRGEGFGPWTPCYQQFHLPSRVSSFQPLGTMLCVLSQQKHTRPPTAPAVTLRPPDLLERVSTNARVAGYIVTLGRLGPNPRPLHNQQMLSRWGTILEFVPQRAWPTWPPPATFRCLRDTPPRRPTTIVDRCRKGLAFNAISPSYSPACVPPPWNRTTRGLGSVDLDRHFLHFWNTSHAGAQQIADSHSQRSLNPHQAPVSQAFIDRQGP